jgi:hypothetical protein
MISLTHDIALAAPLSLLSPPPPSFIDTNRPSSSPALAASGVSPLSKQAESCGRRRRTGGRRRPGSRIACNRSGKKRRKLSYFEGNVVWLEVQKHADLIAV